jgi:Domain of unknown function (DUF4157)
MHRYTVHRLWPWFPAVGIALGRHVFLRDPGSATTLAHELVHVRQQAEHPVWFWVSYVLLFPFGWNPWRMRWEAEAYAVQVRAGCTVEEVARAIAGPLYGWCCRRKAAEDAVRRFLVPTKVPRRKG